MFEEELATHRTTAPPHRHVATPSSDVLTAMRTLSCTRAGAAAGVVPIPHPLVPSPHHQLGRGALELPLVADRRGSVRTLGSQLFLDGRVAVEDAASKEEEEEERHEKGGVRPDGRPLLFRLSPRSRLISRRGKCRAWLAGDSSKHPPPFPSKQARGRGAV